MGYFHIGFVAEPAPSDVMALGEIVIDKFSEPFRAAVGYWSPADYRQSWAVGVERLVTGHG